MLTLSRLSRASHELKVGLGSRKIKKQVFLLLLCPVLSLQCKKIDLGEVEEEGKGKREEK